jgi:flavin-dependent dehydrogenase
VPAKLNAPGLMLVGESAGLVNVPRLKGVHYAIESGRLAAEAAFDALRRGEVAGRRGALDGYDEAVRASYVWKELGEVRNMRQAFDKGFFMGGALASAMTITKGKLPPKELATRPAHPHRSRRPLPDIGRHAHLRQALVRLRIREPHARRPAEPPPRPDERPARPCGDVAVYVPGARLRGGRGGR